MTVQDKKVKNNERSVKIKSLSWAVNYLLSTNIKSDNQVLETMTSNVIRFYLNIFKF